jgi:hypothetical protein
MQGGYGPPQGPQGYGPQGYAPQSYDYEFNDAENKVIGNCATWARVLAIVWFVLGALAIFNCNPFTPIYNGVTGGFMMSAGGSLSAVVKTQGNDVANMMAALRKMRTVFAVRVWATVVLFSLVMIMTVLAVVLVATMVSKMG